MRPPVLEQAVTLAADRGDERAAGLFELALLDEDEGALERAEGRYREAPSLQLAASPQPTATAARTMNALGVVLRKRGQLAEAETQLRQALAARRRFFDPRSLEIASTLNNLAIQLAVTGRYPEAAALFGEVLAIRRARLPAKSLDIADAIENLAQLDMGLAELEKAESSCRESLALRQELLPESHPSTTLARGLLALILGQRGELAEAEELMRLNLGELERAYGSEHGIVAIAREELGWVLGEQERIDDAVLQYRQALAIHRRVAGDQGLGAAGAATRLGAALGRRSEARSKDGAEARALLEGALEVRRGRLGAEDRLTIETTLALARLDAREGEPVRCEERARQSLAAIEHARPWSWFERAETQSVLGECLLARQRPHDAEPLLLDSARPLERLGSDAAPSVRENLERLIRLYESTGRRAEGARLRQGVKRAITEAMRPPR